ncbi:leucine-rich repeat domain-containing protein [Chitinophaga sp. 22620]|uniref:leucine-rich repeat domain-containing protein n=1 Tax=Chitinophaga sp. 22620 TaxID=3453952 RepID=UPI003F826D1D
MIGNTLAAIKALLANEYPELNASLNPPATEADITRFETATGLALPDELKQLYRLHNGESGHAGLFFGLPFISIDEALAEWKTWESLAGSTASLDPGITSVPANHIKEQYVNTRYLPISKDYGGNNIGIDLDPGPDGVSGQVINFGRDEDTRFVIAPSLAGFMEFILHHVKNGNYRFEINGDEEDEEPRSFLLKEPVNSHFLDALKSLQLPFGSKPPAAAADEEDYGAWFAALDATWQEVVGAGQSFAALAGIKNINLIRKNITNLQPLGRFTGLRELLLSGNPVEDISPLASLQSLNKLYIAKTNVRDLSPLAQLKELKQLSVSDTPVASLEALQQLPKLKTLSIEKTAVADLSQVAALRQLTELDISGKQFPSFTELGKLKNLVHLNLSDTNVTDITFLAGLTKLSQLELYGTPVTDFSPLLQMDKLAYLTLSMQDLKQILERLRPGIGITICGETTEEDDAMVLNYLRRK